LAIIGLLVEVYEFCKRGENILLVNTSGHKVVDSAIAFDTGYSEHRELLFHNGILNHKRDNINII